MILRIHISDSFRLDVRGKRIIESGVVPQRRGPQGKNLAEIGVYRYQHHEQTLYSILYQLFSAQSIARHKHQMIEL